MMEPTMTENEQFQCLNTLDMISDLFTISPKESFTREEILVILNAIKHDEELWTPEVVIAQEEATAIELD